MGVFLSSKIISTYQNKCKSSFIVMDLTKYELHSCSLNF